MNSRLKAIAAAAVVAVLAVTVGISQADTSAKAPIVIGLTADLEGYAQSAGVPWTKASDVWAKWINDRGGILGHPVVLLSEDTKSDPATGAAALERLLSNPKVLAVVHGGDDTTPEAYDAVAKATAPVIGGLYDDPMGMNPNVFPASATADAVNEAIVRVGVNSNTQQRNGGFLYVPGDDAPLPILQAATRKAGADLVYVAQIPENAAADFDFASHCRAAKDKNVGWMFLVLFPATVANLAESCAKLDYKPTWVVTFPTTDELKVPALEGMKAVMPNALFSSPNPAAAQFRKAVAKYDPDQLKQPTFGEPSIQAWAALQLIAKAIETAHPQGAEVTRADVYRGLYGLKNETLGGLAPPLTFTRGKPTTISCFFTVEIKKGELVATSPKPDC